MKSVLMSAMIFMAVTANAKEYLVKYHNQSGFEALQEIAVQKSSGMQILGQHQAGSYLKVDLDEAGQTLAMAQMLSNPDIEWVVPNFKIYSFSDVPMDAQDLKEQWAMAKIQVSKAWERAGNQGSKNVLVAVIDTGIDYQHKALAPNMVPGYDFRNNDSDPMDETSTRNAGHGTHCAGAIGATGIIDGGTVGVNPNVSLMPIRFLGSDGSGDLDGGIRSIDYAIEKGVQVISASWGASVSTSNAKALLEAVKRADDKGVIFVAAAANSGKNNDTTDVYPANSGFPNTITVAASNSSDGKPTWSNYGKAKVHVASPGENIISTLPKDSYGSMSGTSMATPIVAGVVAFLKAQDPTLTGAQVRALLQATGAKTTIETACNCRIDAFAAVDYLLAKKPWLVPTATTLDQNTSLTVGVMNGVAPFQFTSSNPAVMTVDGTGVVSAVAPGVATLSVKDATGAQVTSLDYNVLKAGGAGSSCPYSARICEIVCKWRPSTSFCKH